MSIKNVQGNTKKNFLLRIFCLPSFFLLSVFKCEFLIITEPIGLGTATVRITSNVEGHIALQPGEEAKIYGVFGKDLFLVETSKDKKRGFVSQKLFKEAQLKRKGLVKSNITAIRKPKNVEKLPSDIKEPLAQVIKEEEANGISPSQENETPELTVSPTGKPENQPKVAEAPTKEVVLDEEEEEDTEGDDEADEGKMLMICKGKNIFL